MFRSLPHLSLCDIKRWAWFRLLCLIIVFTYGSELIGMDLLRVRSAHAQSMVVVPALGVLLPASSAAARPLLKAISIDPVDPLKIDFLIDAGDHLKVDENEAGLLVKYFLTFLTTPEEDLWVNLSPSEPDRIINEALSRTAVGEDMLREDYLLKQLSASMTFPDLEPGKRFWEQVYSKIHQQNGDVELPLDMFSKVWVVPEKATVYEHNGTAFIAESRLKVVLDEDYLTMKNRAAAGGGKDDSFRQSNGGYRDIARDIIVPELEREVNEGQYFFQLRQMFNALVLAIWFKRKLQHHLINKVYTGQKKFSGVQIEDRQVTQKVYDQYMEALKKGVYNMIREDYDPHRQEVVPRHYFSGGFSFQDAAQKVVFLSSPRVDSMDSAQLVQSLGRNLFHLTMSLIPRGISKKNLFAFALAAGLLLSSPTGSVLSGSARAQFSADANSSHVLEVSQGSSNQANVSQALVVSQHIISRGDLIPDQDRKYFDFMQSFLTIQDFKDIQGQKNPLTGMNYDFSWEDIQGDWDNVFSSSEMQVIQEQVVIVTQHKLGIQEDGDFGPQTRMALEMRMAAGNGGADGGGDGGKGDGGGDQQEVVKSDTQKTAPVEHVVVSYKDDDEDKKVNMPVNKPVNKPLNNMVNKTADDQVHKKTDNHAGQPADQKANKTISKPLDQKVNTPVSKPTHDQSKTVVNRNAGKASGGQSDQPAHVQVNNKHNNGVSASVNNPVLQGYEISTRTAVVLDDIGLVAQINGIVGGLDQRKKEYAKGDVICTITDLAITQRIAELKAWLKIEEQKLFELKARQASGAVTASEISPVEQKIASYHQELAKAESDGSIQVVRAPGRMFAKDIRVSNGMDVNEGAKILDYLAQNRSRFTIELPFSQTYFGRIKGLSIDGVPVKTIISIDWELNPQATRARATFLVELSVPIRSSTAATIEGEILPPGQVGAGVLKGSIATISTVRASNDRMIIAPSTGAVQFFVKEGDRVKKGQLLAIQGGASPTQYNSTLAAYKSVKSQLDRSYPHNGVWHVSSEDIAALEKQLASLKSQLDMYKNQSGRLRITAPEDGIILGLSSMTSSAFGPGEEILHMKTRQVTIGDVFDMNGAVLLPADLVVNIGDQVVVETPSGEYIPATISNINAAPMSNMFVLQGVQAVEIVADDIDHVLWNGLPVRVIIPADDEKGLVAGIFKGASKYSSAASGYRSVTTGKTMQSQNSSGNAKITSDIDPLAVSDGYIAGSTIHVPFTAQGEKVGVYPLAEGILGNDLLNGGLSLDVLKNMKAEEYAKARRFNLSIGVVIKDNKISFTGGVGGIFQGLSGITSGNLLSAAMPTIQNISGELVNAISGKRVKDQGLALSMTRMTQYHMQSVLSGYTRDATDILVDIGNAQHQIDELGALLADLEQARDVVVNRESGGISITSDRENLDDKIADTRADVQALQGKVKQWTNELEFMRGQSSDQGIVADLPWEGDFPGLSQGEIQGMSSAVVSKNYKVKKAETAVEAMEETIRLQKLKLMPVAELQDLYIPERGTRIEIPILDERTAILKDIMQIERQKVEWNLSLVKTEVVNDMKAAFEDIQDLSLRIKQAEKDYQLAYIAWKNKADRPDLYRVDQRVAEREKVTKVSLRLYDLKAAYFKAEAKLRDLQVLEYDRSFVGPSTQAGSVQQQALQSVNQAVGNLPLVLDPQPMKFDQVYFMGMNPQALSQGMVEDGGDVLSAGLVTFKPSHMQAGSAALWPLMASAQLSAQSGPPQLSAQFSSAQSAFIANVTGQILVEDPNPVTRAQVLDLFLQQRQNGKDFYMVAEQVAVRSPYPDVVQRLMAAMITRPDVDPRFFAYVIDQAIRQNNQPLAEQGMYALNDLFIQDTLLQKNWFGSSGGSGGSESSKMKRDDMRKVFLTFLAWTPDNWIGKARLLQSEFLAESELASIYNTLEASTDPEAKAMASLIKDELLRRFASHNAEDFFNKGFFQNITGFIVTSDNIRGAHMRDVLRTHNMSFLRASPSWREMEAYLSPGLKERAEDALKALLASADPLPLTEGSLFYRKMQHISFDSPMPLFYFDVLGFEEQEKNIASSDNMPELARIFEFSPLMRGQALDRLMEFSDGRVLVLQTYLHGNDNDLLSAVEDRNWADLLRKDVKVLRDPVSTGIIRQSMEKMASRIMQDWPLDIRLKTFTYGEIHAAVDQRGPEKVQGQVKVMATEIALDLIEAKIRNSFKFSTFNAAKFEPEETELIQEIRKKIELSNSPDEVNDFLESYEPRDGTTRALLEDIISARDGIVKAINQNDQTLPKVPNGMKWWFWVLAAVGAGGIYKTWQKRMFRKHGAVDDMIVLLREDLVGERKNSWGWRKKLGRMLFMTGALRMESGLTHSTVPENGLNNSSRVRLTKIQGTVRQWNNGSAGVTVERIEHDVNEFLNQYEHILRTMPYEPELMGKGDEEGNVHNGKYQKTFNHFYLSVVEVLNGLDHYLQEHGDISPYQKEAFLIGKARLKKMLEYVTLYLDIFECRGSIDKLMGYKFPDSHWLEKKWFGFLRIYPTLRAGLMYTYQINTSFNRIFRQLPLLIERGNALMPGLYGTDQNIFGKSQSILTQMIAQAETLHSLTTANAANLDRQRRILSRTFLYMTPVALLGGLLTSFIGMPLLSTSLTVIGLVNIFIRFSVFWWAQHNITKMAWLQDMEAIMKKLDHSLNQRLGALSGHAAEQEDVTRMVVERAVADGRAVVQEVLAGERQGVDMILIISKPSAEEEIRDYVDSRRQQLFNPLIPVEIVSIPEVGSGNVQLRAMQAVRDNLRDPGFLARFPHLKGRSPDDVRPVFIFHGDEGLHDRRILDWALVNGYRVARKLKQDNPSLSGGQILVYSRDVYFGPMLEFTADKDINVQADWVNADQLKYLGLLVMDTDGKTNVVSEVREKLNIEELQRADSKKVYSSKVMALLKERFDLRKRSLAQFPAMSGLMVFSRKTVNILGAVLDQLEKNPRLWDSLPPIHLTNDLLNPLLLDDGPLLHEYLETRISLLDVFAQDMVFDKELLVRKNKARELYWEYYHLFIDARNGRKIEASAIIPNYSSAKVFHVKTQSEMHHVSRLLGQAGLDKAEVLSAVALSSVLLPDENGGLDFTAASDAVIVDQSPYLRAHHAQTVAPEHSLRFLQLFRGFDFRIMSLRSLEDPRIFLRF